MPSSDSTPFRPLAHTGDSANIAWYYTADRQIQAEVLRSDRFPHEQPRPTRFYVTVRDNARTPIEVGRFTYEPKSKPRPGRLPDRTVNRLVRNWLDEQRGENK